MKYLIATILISMACSDEPVTWGEVSEEVAHAVCWKSYSCDVHDDINLCMEHEKYHLCGLAETCNEPSYGSIDALVYQCTWAIYDAECSDGEFEWPDNCVHAFKHLRPPGFQ